MKISKMLLTGLMIISSAWLFGQSKTVTGTVTSEDSGETLPGATVVVEGTTNGVVTDIDGKFSIQTEVGKTLIVSFIGMQDRKVTIGTANNYNVQLLTGINLDEFVVTALGVTREKKSLGYATSELGEDEITKGEDRSVLNAMQGKIPGVNISTGGGTPGGSTRIFIRGIHSISQNNQPLFVVDGVPMSNTTSGNTSLDGGYDFGNGANAIAPEDVANVSVLKGASATALYGSRAANGVILITTKSGSKSKSGKKALGISYSGNLTFSNVLRLPTFQNEFGQGWDATHYLGENGSWGPLFDDKQRVWGNVVDNSQLIKPYSALESNVKDFFETGVSYNNHIAIDGGNETSSFYASFSNTKNNGIFPTDVDEYQRNTVALRASHEVGIFNFGGTFNFSQSNVSAVPTGQGPTVYNNIMQIPRDISIVDMEDYNNKFYNLDNYFTYYGVINPYYTLNEFGSKFRQNKFFGSFEAGADVTSWSKLTYRFGFDSSTDKYHIWEAMIQPSPGSYNVGTSIDDLGSVTKRLFEQQQFNHDLIYNMNFDLSNDLTLDALIGGNYNERRFSDLQVTATDLSIPGFYDVTNSPSTAVTVPNEELRRYGGIYAQTSFGFKDYLFLNLTARNDWSSTLPLDNNSYFYSGANLSWVFTDMFDNITSKAFNYGKLRVGYGTTGNDADPYLIYDKFVQTSIPVPFIDYNYPVSGINSFSVSNVLGNPELNPEITREFEIGGEFRFFSRLTAVVTYYNRTTSDLILQVPIDPASGYSSQVQNVGEIENKGIEALVTVDILKRDDLGGFTWNLGVNYSNNENEVLSLNEGTEKISLGGLSTIGYFAVPGMPIGVYEGNVAMTTPSGQIVVDANGVPVASTEKEFYGNSQYDYILGITNQFGYKNFTLSAVIDIRQGGLMFTRTADINHFTGNGIKTIYNDRKPFVVPNSVQEVAPGEYVENTTAVDQQHIDDYHSADFQDRGTVIDKSFLKLREVVISYQLPKQILANTPFASVSASIFGRNLLLYTPVENQFIDPETTTFGNDIAANYGEFSSNPSVRSYGISLRATF